MIAISPLKYADAVPQATFVTRSQACTFKQSCNVSADQNTTTHHLIVNGRSKFWQRKAAANCLVAIGTSAAHRYC